MNPYEYRKAIEQIWPFLPEWAKAQIDKSQGIAQAYQKLTSWQDINKTLLWGSN